MKTPIVNIKNLNLHYGQKAVLKDLDWTINRGENWLLSGASGSGKTSLAKIIAGIEGTLANVKIEFTAAGELPQKVLLVASWYQFANVDGDKNFYHSQRYNHQQLKETNTIEQELAKYGAAHQLNWVAVGQILKALDFAKLKNAQLLELSSGEHKKIQLVKALWLKPQLLIIDQPYTGLDARSRENLNDLLAEIAEDGTTLILISNDDELPTCINRFAVIKKGKLIEEFVHQAASALTEIPLGKLPAFLTEKPNNSSDVVVEMKDVNISYGDKKVLKNITWKVDAGERWLLQGDNGSGKSTLLSLISGDHPQAYANEIYLFGNRRGSGESIWDIKKRIGLISPEFHWYFDSNQLVWQSIASGFHDTVGLLQNIGYAEKQKVNELIDFFGLTDVRNETLASLPLGKQRLVLLARTVIKNPELLILDEPCQGLDGHQTSYFNRLINELSGNGMTIIYVGHFETQLPNCIDHKLILNNGSVEISVAIETNLAEAI